MPKNRRKQAQRRKNDPSSKRKQSNKKQQTYFIHNFPLDLHLLRHVDCNNGNNQGDYCNRNCVCLIHDTHQNRLHQKNERCKEDNNIWNFLLLEWFYNTDNRKGESQALAASQPKFYGSHEGYMAGASSESKKTLTASSISISSFPRNLSLMPLNIAGASTSTIFFFVCLFDPDSI